MTEMAACMEKTSLPVGKTQPNLD